MSTDRCSVCGGARWIVPDLPIGHPQFGRSVRCTACDIDYSRKCGLTDTEQMFTAESIKGATDTQRTLRYLVSQIADNPVGWLTLYGAYGTAKTLAVQCIVAELVRRKRPARFLHAKQVEQMWFDDMHGDTMRAKTLRDAPILAIDELDKCNLKSDWVRQQFQSLLDHRYRQAVAGSQLTLITLQGEPEQLLPGDIASRMRDGRFARPWTGKPNEITVNQWGVTVVPGCIHIAGADMRPNLPPAFVTDKRKR